MYSANKYALNAYLFFFEINGKIELSYISRTYSQRKE